jgi:hypothetical protein
MVELGAAGPAQTSLEGLPALIAAVALDRGIVARCLCGHARFCPFSEHGTQDYEQFHAIHARCLPA